MPEYPVSRDEALSPAAPAIAQVGGKSVGLWAMGVPLKRTVWIVVLDNLFDLGLPGILVAPALLFLRSGISSAGFIVLAAGLILALAAALWWATATGRMLSRQMVGTHPVAGLCPASRHRDLRRFVVAQMGVKPIYYTGAAGQLIFGSEMKVLLAHPDVARDIDLVSLNEYLSFEYVPSPRTIIRNVYRLEPGHSLRYDARGIHIRQYWNLSLARSESRPPVNWRDYASNLRDTLRDAVRQELVSDVPVGVLLSGGIDSSTVAALMVESYPGTVDSFSIGFEDASFDESRYARLAARCLGTRHHELVFTSGMAAEMVLTITDFMDEPFGDSSLIPTFLLSQFTRERVKVVLGGDGGDELFAGYPTLVAHKLIEYYKRIVPWYARAYIVPRVLNLMPVSFNNISLDFKVRRFLSGRGVPVQARHHRWLGSFVDEDKSLLLQDWIKPVLRDTYAQAYAHARECDARLLLNQVLYDDTKMYLEGDILFKVDRASMATSLEVRVPFLNRDGVDFVTGLPLELKLHRLTGKYLLKKSVERMLPREIMERPKKGFNMPVANWLTGELRDLLLYLLSEVRVARQGLFNYAYVKQLIDEHLSRQRDNRKLLWTLLMFQLWYNAYIESDGPQ